MIGWVVLGAVAFVVLVFVIAVVMVPFQRLSKRRKQDAGVVKIMSSRDET